MWNWERGREGEFFDLGFKIVDCGLRPVGAAPRRELIGHRDGGVEGGIRRRFSDKGIVREGDGRWKNKRRMSLYAHIKGKKKP